METTGIIGIIQGLYRYILGYIGKVEKKMHTTIMDRVFLQIAMGLFGGYLGTLGCSGSS